MKFIKPLIIGLALSLVVGCSGGKFFSGDINKNGEKDSIKTKYDKETQEFYITLTENEVETTIFYGEGKKVSKPKVVDLDNDGMEDIVFAFQEKDSEKRILYAIINNTDTESFVEEKFIVKEIDGLPYKDRNVRLWVKELPNNTPLLIVDNDAYHLERNKWEKYDLQGRFIRKDFDINNDNLGDFVLFDENNNTLNFMVSDKDKSYQSISLNSEKKITDLEFNKDGSITVHKLLDTHSETETTMVIGFKGNLTPGTKTITVYEMRKDTYELKNNKFEIVKSEEYETESSGGLGYSFGGSIGIGL